MGGGMEIQQPGNIYIYLWLIHVDVWQKLTQYCKAIILQLKKIVSFLATRFMAICYRGNKKLIQAWWKDQDSNKILASKYKDD